MKVRVLSKNGFDALLARMRLSESEAIRDNSKAFISILSSDIPDSSYFKNEAANVIKLTFDDVTDTELEWKAKSGQDVSKFILFDRLQAKKIVDFLEVNKTAETLYIHCTAGVSRSGAVGVFANDVCGEQSFFDFCNNNPQIRPNSFVLALLRRVYDGINDE